MVSSCTRWCGCCSKVGGTGLLPMFLWNSQNWQKTTSTCRIRWPMQRVRHGQNVLADCQLNRDWVSLHHQLYFEDRDHQERLENRSCYPRWRKLHHHVFLLHFKHGCFRPLSAYCVSWLWLYPSVSHSNQKSVSRLRRDLVWRSRHSHHYILRTDGFYASLLVLLILQFESLFENFGCRLLLLEKWEENYKEDIWTAVLRLVHGSSLRDVCPVHLSCCASDSQLPVRYRFSYSVSNYPYWSSNHVRQWTSSPCLLPSSTS